MKRQLAWVGCSGRLPVLVEKSAYTAFEHAWGKRCPGVVTSLREGGDEVA